MAVARSGHTATLLPSGKVLMAGGYKGTGNGTTAELYDPSAGQFTDTGSMAAARTEHTATRLLSGKVLVGGGDWINVEWGTSLRATAELYDPSTGQFTGTGSMAVGRSHHTATLVPSGKVLYAGGFTEEWGHVDRRAELYNP
jgi:hypothetical protein